MDLVSLGLGLSVEFGDVGRVRVLNTCDTMPPSTLDGSVSLAQKDLVLLVELVVVKMVLDLLDLVPLHLGR